MKKYYVTILFLTTISACKNAPMRPMIDRIMNTFSNHDRKSAPSSHESDSGTPESSDAKPQTVDGQSNSVPEVRPPSAPMPTPEVLPPPIIAPPVVAVPAPPPVGPQPLPPPIPAPILHPVGCEGDSVATTSDLVIFGGEALRVLNNSIALRSGWTLHEAWDNGVIGVEIRGGRSAFTFSKETIFHGFKISPPSKGGKRQNFTATAIELYTEGTRLSSNELFGVRMIQPGEDETNGGAPSTTWFQKNADNDLTVFENHIFPISTGCRLTTAYMPRRFLNGDLAGNRMIWEMQRNWDVPDKLFVYRIVLKNFRWK